MNTKRWALASLAAFVVIFVLEAITNGVILDGLYQQTASVWRPQAEMQRLMWLWWVVQLITALVFTWIYAKGYEVRKSGVGQGLRYGLAMGIIFAAPSLGWYAVLPIPGVIACGWFVAGLVDGLAAGVAVGLIYRPE